MAEHDERDSDGKLGLITTLRRSFDRSFLAFVGLSVVAGVATYYGKGPDAFHRALGEALDFAVFILPRMTAALLIAAFIQVLVPREIVSRLIGERAGLKGILIATVAGAATPGGPLSAFPIVVALYATGANKGALVAYISSWAMLGFQRILVWEYPLMGADFTILRLCASVALPVIAGLVAARLPWEIHAPAAPRGRGRS